MDANGKPAKKKLHQQQINKAQKKILQQQNEHNKYYRNVRGIQ
jgi:hypothetical protein